MENMRILFASSEAVPFAKTGGLADVAGSLPKAVKKMGHDIRLIIPKYKCIPELYTKNAEYVGYTYVDLGWRHQYCGILKTVINGLTVYLLDNEYYFYRDGLYGYPDECEQFTFFNKALLQALPIIGFKPDIIHCNDWQTGIIGLLLNAHYRRLNFYSGIKTLYTIHNLKYQGVFPKKVLNDVIGVGWEYFTPEGVEYYDCVNFMKAGLVYSDAISSVSKTYVEEIKYDFYGENLNQLIRKRSDSLYGIVNGIDFEENNPATDKRLYVNYDSENPEGKKINKKELQHELGLPQKEKVPLIGIISRLVDQKGFDLIAYVLEELLKEDLQIVILGTGDYRYEEMFKSIAYRYNKKVSANIKYDGTLAQRIYAGSDMFLMPSLFEPCGLGQLFSLRYGSVPIVRETGGLNDTITSYNEETGEGNGFSFKNYNAHDMLYTIRRALKLYSNKTAWKNIVKRCMQQDFSWDKSACEYVELYDNLMK